MSNTNTPLFKEALVESQKLREIAVHEAKQAVLNSITPLIKEMLGKELENGLFEEEDPMQVPSDQAVPSPADASIPPMQQPIQQPIPADASGNVPEPQAAVPPTEAPTPEVTPSTDTAVAPIPTDSSIPMPGPDGQITVALGSLFDTTPEGQAPVLSGETQAPPMETPIPDATGDATASPTDIPTEMPAATDATTPPVEETPIPTSPEEQTPPLKESIRQHISRIATKNCGKTLLEQKAYEQELFSVFEKNEQLMAVDKVSATFNEMELNVLYSNLQESQKNLNSYYRQKDTNMAKKQIQSLEQFTRALFEEVSADGAAGFGDGGKGQEKVKNSNEKETASAHAKKASESRPVQDPGKKDSLTVNESELPGSGGASEVMEEEPDLAMLEQELMEMLGEEEMLADEDETLEENVNVKISIESDEGEPTVEVEDGMSGGMETDSDIDGLSDDETIEIVDDEETPSDLEGGEEGSELPPEETSVDNEEDSELETLAEARKENAVLKAQLQEARREFARSLYVGRLFANYTLSESQKRKIVEYLDSARNESEAKATYLRIKKILSEATKQPINESTNRKTGSSAGRGRSVLNESNDFMQKYSFDTDRWSQLAGINKKSQ